MCVHPQVRAHVADKLVIVLCGESTCSLWQEELLTQTEALHNAVASVRAPARIIGTSVLFVKSFSPTTFFIKGSFYFNPQFAILVLMRAWG